MSPRLPDARNHPHPNPLPEDREREQLALAFEHHRAGRFAEAEPVYRAILEVQPNDAAAWHGWGLLAAQQGAIGSALQRVSRAVELAPAEPSFWNTLGRLHAERRDFPAAAEAYRRAVALDPTAAHIWKQLSVALRKTGDLVDSIGAGERAIRLLPDDAEAHNQLGNALCDAGRDEEAVDRFRQAVRLRPDGAETCTNLGSTLTRLGEVEEALRWCDQAVRLAPMLPEGHNNRGVALAATGRFAEAVTAYRRAIELRPDYAAAHSNLGVAICNGGGDAEEALAACQQAVALQSGDAVLHTNHGMILLTLGRYADGWAEHEYRLAANPRISPHPFPQPRWRGEPLPAGTILLHAEQGFGDTIQFARFVPMVAQRVGRVVLEVQPELAGLLSTAWPALTVVPRGQPLPAFDVHCPLMSLGSALGIVDPSMIPTASYLHAESRHVWTDGRHLGLVWAGRPTHSNDRHRSALLASFAPLAALPGITLHSLQKGPAALEAHFPPAGLRLQRHDDDLHDFAATAALIASLDGVIAVDTAVAHLAGAMGKPVWLVLPKVADWRWMRDRTDTPWYPTMRLYRQSGWGDWSAPVKELTNDLRRF